MLVRRPAVAADLAFLRELYLTTRPDLSGWDDEARDTLVDLQLRARQREWEAAYPGSTDEVLMVDGVPVGRVWTAFVPGACVVVDLALLPEHRRRGLGTQVLGEVVAEADQRGVPVRVTVERTNVPVRALNARLGFVETGGDEIHLRMERPVPGRSASG
jgi:ribosomal protein S18 acetylase RimI-like enzyme